jgi:hypothetical protein
MKKVSIGIMIFGIIVLIIQLIVKDYNNVNFSDIAWNFLGIFSMISIIIGVILSQRNDKKSVK